MVEKAKTTPDTYPMSLNALVTGCNQKNNRYPLTNLDEGDVDTALELLRKLGAAAEVQGGGRVARYRHYFYDWLGVDKVEAAVMCELLLRGAQTEGELRTRASRMEPIADLDVLRKILQSLADKRLVLSLTPQGRGHVVSHNLYEPRELEKLHTQFAGMAAAALDEAEDEPAIVSGGSAPTGDVRTQLLQLRDEVSQLRQQLQDVQDQVQQLRSALGV